jgi:hypothetical protein
VIDLVASYLVINQTLWLEFSDSEFHKFHIRNKANNFTWSLVVMYADDVLDDRKTAFLCELDNVDKYNQ